jgi:hypothetical protein
MQKFITDPDPPNTNSSRSFYFLHLFYFLQNMFNVAPLLTALVSADTHSEPDTENSRYLL